MEKELRFHFQNWGIPPVKLFKWRALKIQVSDKRKIGKILADLRYIEEQKVELAMERQQVAERHLCDLLQSMGLDYENDTGQGG